MGRLSPQGRIGQVCNQILDALESCFARSARFASLPNRTHL